MSEPPSIFLALRYCFCCYCVYYVYETDKYSTICYFIIVTLALADKAFENKLESLKDIYNPIVPPDADRTSLETWAERPVFHDIDITANGVRISMAKPFQYSKYRYFFVNVGRVLGYEKALRLYRLRRGSGKELDGVRLPLVLLEVDDCFIFPPWSDEC